MRVYPRVCGGTTDGQGSVAFEETGSIPACAGEPTSGNLGNHLRKVRVYPRVCGGTMRRRMKPRSDNGLSPRVLGNHSRRRRGLHSRGSIPACAGEPLTRCGCPRVGAPEGLSPRVRGNLLCLHGRSLMSLNRSIPACAGEPGNNGVYWAAAQSSVYPRVCGGPERMAVRGTCLTEMGLSPRVRGNPGARDSHHEGARSIPACAGEPKIGWVKHILHAVYPRVCGGTKATTAPSLAAGGLSPRVRGNRLARASSTIALRSIPACAGEPPIR